MSCSNVVESYNVDFCSLFLVVPCCNVLCMPKTCTKMACSYQMIVIVSYGVGFFSVFLSVRLSARFFACLSCLFICLFVCLALSCSADSFAPMNSLSLFLWSLTYACAFLPSKPEKIVFYLFIFFLI